jgi:hypothetical protein
MEKVRDFRLSGLTLVLINLAGLVLFFICYIAFIFGVYIYNRGLLHYFFSSNVIYLLLTSVAVIIIHELFHAIPYRIFGAKIKFGITPLYAYVMDISRKAYPAWQMIFILLFPLFILSALLALLIAIFPPLFYYLGMGILINLIGSTGDMFMALYLTARGRNYYVRDEKYGMSLYRE